MEDLRLDALMRKAGTAYRLVTLFQKRMREIERGWPPLVDAREKEIYQIVAEEVENDLIHLATDEEAESLREQRDLEEAEIQRRRTVRDARLRLTAGPVSESPGAAPPGPPAP